MTPAEAVDRASAVVAQALQRCRRLEFANANLRSRLAAVTHQAETYKHRAQRCEKAIHLAVAFLDRGDTASTAVFPDDRPLRRALAELGYPTVPPKGL